MNKKLLVLAVAGTISFIIGGLNSTTLYGTQYLTSNVDYSYGIGLWWNSSFSYRKLITINSSQVDSDLVNFPILVNITDTDLRDDAQDDGDDIVFVMCYGKNTRLNHETEHFNGTTGELIAWVNVTSLSSTEDTVLYIYYGNSTCSNQQNPTGIWDTNYKGVWHLSETPDTEPLTSEILDSTASNNDGNSNDMTSDDQVSGRIDGSLNFSGSSTDDIDMGDVLDQPTNDFTISAWIKTPYSDYTAPVVNKMPSDITNGTTFGQVQYQSGRWALELRINGTRYSAQSASGSVWADKWVFVVGTVDRDGFARIYVNGTEAGSVDISAESTVDISNVQNFKLGEGNEAYAGGNTNFPGLIDEVRISNIIRNASWINTCYNTMNSPSTFLNVGIEEIQS